MNRSRADRCPGVFRPWPAADGALVRLRIPGGRVSLATLAGLLSLAEEYGDGRVHLTSRANLQVRGLPGGSELPAEVVEAIRATGLLPHPGHELVRNIMCSPLTGLLGGRADLGPVISRLDEHLVRRPSLANLPGRFLFVLDDGRGDLLDRSLDLGLVALDETTAQLRLGSRHWGPVVPLAEAPERLIGLARAFLSVRGTDSSAAWHVDELDQSPAGLPREPRTEISTGPPPLGVLGPGLRHLAAPDAVVDRRLLETLTGPQLVVTPWRSLLEIQASG